MDERKETFTPGPWRVRTREAFGVVRDCFVAANDVNGYPYDAEILGDDEYCDQLPRKLADAHLIAAAPDLYEQNQRAAKKLRDVKAFLEANPVTEQMTANWDGTECDGSALLEEVNAQLADLERVAAKARGEA